MNIPLNHGKSVIIDDEDYELIKNYKWHYNHNPGYAKSSSMGKKVYMHRLINKTPKNKMTDHINGDKLDNRKVNLRTCDMRENVINRRLRPDNTSGFRGVSMHWPREWQKRGWAKSWKATIHIYNKQIVLGYFKSKEQAAQAYNVAAKKYYGEFAVLNGL